MFHARKSQVSAFDASPRSWGAFGRLALVVAIAVFAGQSTATACGWKAVSSPNAGTSDVLEAMSNSSASDVWAVGNYYGPTGGPLDLAVHWDGSAWNLTPAPNPFPLSDQLFGVTALSPSDAWAVGFGRASGGTQAIILHWNGATWKQVAAPGVPGSQTYLWSVHAVNAKDVWAAGNSATSGFPPIAPLAEHWNGSKWSVVPTPNSAGYGGEFFGVSASGPNDVWATGASATTTITAYVTLTEHFDGTKWSVVPSPNAGAKSNLFYAALDVAPNDVWGIGNFYTGSVYNTLTEHWDGKSWNVVASPNAGASGGGLFGVAAFSSMAVWAVGETFKSTGGGAPLTIKWNGKKWAVVKSADLQAGSPAFFEGTTAIRGSGTVWAAGLGTLPSGRNNETLTASNSCGANSGNRDAVAPPASQGGRSLPADAARRFSVLPAYMFVRIVGFAANCLRFAANCLAN